MKNQNPIPDFDAYGNLPEGVYEVDISRIEHRFAWNRRRKALFWGLCRAVENLKAAGVEFVYIDGSFTTDKEAPNDIDGCWVPNKKVKRSVIDEVFLDRNPPRQRMKEKYGVDFLIAGLDFGGYGKAIEEFFQSDRRGRRKGILLLSLSNIELKGTGI